MWLVFQFSWGETLIFSTCVVRLAFLCVCFWVRFFGCYIGHIIWTPKVSACKSHKSVYKFHVSVVRTTKHPTTSIPHTHKHIQTHTHFYRPLCLLSQTHTFPSEKGFLLHIISNCSTPCRLRVLFLCAYPIDSPVSIRAQNGYVSWKRSRYLSPFSLCQLLICSRYTLDIVISLFFASRAFSHWRGCFWS